MDAPRLPATRSEPSAAKAESIGDVYGTAEQAAEKWMFFCRTCRAKAFSRLSFVRFCVPGLDFDPVAMPFSSPNPWSPAAGAAYAAD